MRKDIGKVIHEHTRKGNTRAQTSSIARRRDKDNLQKELNDPDNAISSNKRSIKGHARSWDTKVGRKTSYANRNPIRRFINSRVGSPWDEVYSEIMKGATSEHSAYKIREMLFGYGMVEDKTYIRDGVIYSKYISGDEVKITNHWCGFFVHPETGLLCKNVSDSRWRRPPKAIPPCKDGDELVQFHRINGIWYEITLREPSEDELEHKGFGKYERVSHNHSVWTPMFSNYIADLMWMYAQGSNWWNLWEKCKELFGEPLLPLSKRQLNSKEIKKYVTKPN